MLCCVGTPVVSGVALVLWLSATAQEQHHSTQLTTGLTTQHTGIT